MNNKIYLKETKDNLWTNNPALAMLITCLIIIIPAIWKISLLEDILGPLSTLLIIFLPAYITVKMNLRHNISKSTAFIFNDGHLYAIQLFETKERLVNNSSSDIINMPAGTVAQAASISNNLKTAKQTMAYENEIRDRRENPAAFYAGLQDVMDFKANNPNQVKHYTNLTGYDRYVKDHGENCGLMRLDTDTARYTFAELKNPKIEKISLKTFLISFDDEGNIRRTIKFSKCFDKLIEDIQYM